ncbi:hypothetical protein BJ912DRAFT_855677, partial [Pholiota molesta]
MLKNKYIFDNIDNPVIYNYGGGFKTRVYSYSSLQPYINSDTTDVSSVAQFRYVAHVNDIDLLKYPEEKYLYTSIPLHKLFELITVTQSRKIAIIHNLSQGSRSTISQLVSSAQGHSCFACSKYITVFSYEKSISEQAKERQRSKTSKNSIQSKIDQSINKGDNFPPNAIKPDQLCDIITSAYSKMTASVIEEAGCAVCGELKPLKTLSRLKGIKNLLHILHAPGVTRVERKSKETPIREYSGPVLDYSCNRVSLEWLKLNHSDYADIEISMKNLNEYSETSAPVSIEYRKATTNKEPENTSVFDKELEDGTEEGD